MLNLLKVVVSPESQFAKDSAAFVKEPFSFMLKRRLPLSQCVTFLLYDKLINKTNSDNKRALESIYLTVYLSFFKVNRNAIDKFVSTVQVAVDGEANVEEAVAKRVRERFGEYFTNGAFKRSFADIYVGVFEGKKAEYKWNTANGEPLMKNLISPPFLRKLENLLNSEVTLGKNLVSLICPAFNSATLKEAFELYNACTPEQLKDEESKVFDFIRLADQKSTSGKKKKLITSRAFLELEKKLRKEFVAYFKDIHMHIVPISQEELNEHNAKHKTKLTINKENGLVVNACMARKCPHFLKYNRRKFRHHMDIWGYRLPRNFHSVVHKNKGKGVEEIYSKFVGQYSGFKPEDFDVSKEDVLEYIKLIKQK